MEHTYVELKKKTVGQLRDIAKELKHEAVQGYTQLNKEHLLVAVCNALAIDMHEHHRAVGADKIKIKQKIRELKKKRDEYEAARNPVQLRFVLRTIHRLKRKLHKTTV